MYFYGKLKVMIHIKTIKDDRGKIGIRVSLIDMAYFHEEVINIRYDVSVFVTPKGKRKNKGIDISFCSPKEIMDAKLELWNKLKPV
jgi:hypothetical protein